MRLRLRQLTARWPIHGLHVFSNSQRARANYGTKKPTTSWCESYGCRYSVPASRLAFANSIPKTLVLQFVFDICALGARVTWLDSMSKLLRRRSSHGGGGATHGAPRFRKVQLCVGRAGAIGWVNTTSRIRRWQRCGRSCFAQLALRRGLARCTSARFKHGLLSFWPRPRARPPMRRSRHTRRRRSHRRPRRPALRDTLMVID